MYRCVINCNYPQCLHTLAFGGVNIKLDNIAVDSLLQEGRRAETSTLVDNGSMFAFAGAAAIGNVGNVFQFLDMVFPFRVISALPTALTV